MNREKKLYAYIGFLFEKTNKLICGFLLITITGCFDFNSSNESSKFFEKENTSFNDGKKKNVIHNFVSYKTVDLKKELEKYSGVESVQLKSLDGSSSLYLSGSSLNRSKPVSISSSSSELKLIIKFQGGKELVRLLK